MKKVKKEHKPFQTILYMICETWHLQKKVVLFCIFTAVLHVMLNLAELMMTPMILRLIENKASLSQLFMMIGVFVLLFMIIGAVTRYIEQNETYPLTRLSMTLDIRNLTKRMRTSYPNTEDPDMNASFQNVENAIYGEESIGDMWICLRMLMESVIGLVIYLYLMVSLSYGLLLIVAVTSIFGFLVSKKYNEWRRHRMDKIGRLFNRMSRITEYERDNAYAKDMWLYNMYPWMKKLFYDTQRDYRHLSLEIEKQRFKGESIDIFMGLIRNALAYAYLLNLTLKQGLSASTFLLYFSAITGLAGWITSITSSLLKLGRDTIGLSEIRKINELEEPFLLDSGEAVPRLSACEITLDHVSFVYPGADRPSIDDLTLTIHAGEKLAVVGENGAGKTTLINLISGLYDPTKGRVLLNGRDIRELNRRQYYDLFAAVFQEYSLLDGTLEENLMPSGETIEEQKLMDIMEKSGFIRKYRSLPEGLQTQMGRTINPDGTELSGGEKQRLLLARALCKEAPCLLLDEPTAALDPIAEHEIYMRYNEMTEGCTAIFISHRLASTRFCDRILYMENGRILEQGTHEELIKAKGKYAEFYEIQSHYYREGEEADETKG